MVGHIDHGKTALTFALTGVITDRLAEEQRRGITIESGFAPLLLPDGSTAALVDVPGHERLIGNMLSGAAGLDGVLLVVAADDGPMPQTREHLDICALLGITRGVVAITKCDLVSRERLARVSAQIRELTAGTFLEQAPLLPVSARTGLGIPPLKAALLDLARALPPPTEGLPARMAIDRVFSKDGYGTIATGTLTGGTLSVGDTLQIYPSDRCARVRGLQCHGRAVPALTPGCRAAVNLAGIEKADLHRGDTLAPCASMVVTDRAEVTLTLLPHAAFGVKTGSRLHLYCGTQEVLCRCTLHGHRLLAPGEAAPARLRFSAPLALRAGDRFVVRFCSPAATIGGGVVEAFSRPCEQVRPDAATILADYHARFPLREGMNREDLLGRLGGGQLESLAAEGVLKLRGPVACLPEFRPKYTPALAAQRDRLELLYRRYRLEPEENRAVDGAFDADLIARLLRDGVLVALNGCYRVHRDALAKGLAAAQALCAAEGVIGLGRYRDVLGISRKYALLLLEYWDRAGVTVPAEGGRILSAH